MKEITDAKEIMNIELNIMKEIHDFCNANHIQYFLWGGSLLGAIRHDGFIPWDDDIDIAMPRKDYEIFMNTFMSARYKALSCETNLDYPYSFGKVIDLHTLKIEPIKNPIKMGIDVDIFPIDDYSDDAFKKENINSRLSLLKARYYLARVKEKNNFIKSIIIEVYRSVLKIIYGSANKVSRRINAEGQKTINDSIDYMLYVDFNIQKPLKIEKSWVKKLVLHKFEDTELYIPEGYHELLTACYGDYMTPPPVEKQITHHTNKMYVKD